MNARHGDARFPATATRTSETGRSLDRERSAPQAFSIPLLAGFALLLLAAPALAEQVAREQDIVELRLGQRILVDDGSCPTGQIKEVSGAQMTTTGIVRVRKCIPRLGTKKR
jgi:hypothetical protein